MLACVLRTLLLCYCLGLTPGGEGVALGEPVDRAVRHEAQRGIAARRCGGITKRRYNTRSGGKGNSHQARRAGWSGLLGGRQGRTTEHAGSKAPVSTTWPASEGRRNRCAGIERMATG